MPQTCFVRSEMRKHVSKEQQVRKRATILLSSFSSTMLAFMCEEGHCTSMSRASMSIVGPDPVFFAFSDVLS